MKSFFRKAKARLKAWFGYMEFLGRARRRSTKRLTLESLERELRVQVGGARSVVSGRLPRFAALRFALFGDRGLAPWVTESGVMKMAVEESPDALTLIDGSSGTYPYVVAAPVLASIATMFMMPAVFGAIYSSVGILEGLSVVLGVGLVFASLTCILERNSLAQRYLERRSQRNFGEEGDVVALETTSSMSEAMVRFIKARLDDELTKLVGSGSPHSTNRARAKLELAQFRTLRVKLCLRIAQVTGVDVVEDILPENCPEHLRVAWRELLSVERTARYSLEKVEEFEVRVRVLVEEMLAQVQAPLAMYDDLVLIREVSELAVSVRQTAADTRRLIQAALEGLQDRMEELKSDVMRREVLIGEIVAALPSSRGSTDVGQELEDIVQGLASPARQRTHA